MRLRGELHRHRRRLEAAMAQRAEVVLRGDEREVLERWARRPTSAQALALRCRIVLAAAGGEPSNEIAARLGCSRQTVGRWRGRFARRGLDGLHDEPRPGKPRSIADEHIERVIVKTLEESPPDATHWSTRSMAAATGMSQSAISRIWRAFRPKPHQTEAFKLSPDPQFIDLRPGDRRHGPTPSRRGVPPLSEPDRLIGAGASERARRTRRLRHAQNPIDPALARAPPALHAALHAHLQLLAEPRRALVRRADHEM